MAQIFQDDEKKLFSKLLKSHNHYSKLCFCLRYPFHVYVDIPSPENVIKRKEK